MKPSSTPETDADFAAHAASPAIRDLAPRLRASLAAFYKRAPNDIRWDDDLTKVIGMDIDLSFDEWMHQVASDLKVKFRGPTRLPRRFKIGDLFSAFIVE